MRIEIDLATQTLKLRGAMTQTFAVSTAANGSGEINGSGCTPRGRHRIRARIGAGAPRGAVFVGRRWTGEIWSPQLHTAHPGRDWILTRILWLCGCEPGINRFGAVDTMRRYIYIHGTPETAQLGQAVSHGCVRMSSDDVCTLFDAVRPGTEVWIH